MLIKLQLFFSHSSFFFFENVFQLLNDENYFISNLHRLSVILSYFRGCIHLCISNLIFDYQRINALIKSFCRLIFCFVFVFGFCAFSVDIVFSIRNVLWRTLQFIFNITKWNEHDFWLLKLLIWKTSYILTHKLEPIFGHILSVQNMIRFCIENS